MQDADDRLIWKQATLLGAVVVTKDEDFARRRSLEPTGPQIVWLRIGNATRRQILTWLEPRFEAVCAALARGKSVIEVTD